MSDEERRYSDHEVSLIIQSALENPGALRSGSGDGLLLSDIEAIARETGIPLEDVRRAVEGFEKRKKPNLATFWLGEESTFEKLERLPGSLTKEELASLENALPSMTNPLGSSRSGSGFLAWNRSAFKSALDAFPLQLRVENAGSGIEILARARLTPAATVIFALSSGIGALAGLKVAALSLMLFGTSGLGIPLVAALLALGGLVGLSGFWLLARRAYRAYVKRTKARVAAIMEGIKAAIQGARR